TNFCYPPDHHVRPLRVALQLIKRSHQTVTFPAFTSQIRPIRFRECCTLMPLKIRMRGPIRLPNLVQELIQISNFRTHTTTFFVFRGSRGHRGSPARISTRLSPLTGNATDAAS